MRSPQSSVVMVWLLAGLATANVTAAEPGRGDDRRAARSPWFHKLDRGLQRAVEDGSNAGDTRRRVIIRTRAGANASGLDKANVDGRFGLSLVGGLLAEVKAQDLEALAANPDVEGISV